MSIAQGKNPINKFIGAFALLDYYSINAQTYKKTVHLRLVMYIELVVPAVGESINEVFLGQWLKLTGDTVIKDEPLVEIETDKATLEIPSPVNGTLKEILKKDSDSANVGEVIAYLEESTVTSSVASPPVKSQTKPQATPSEKISSDNSPSFVMPAAARLAANEDIDTSKIKATGPQGRLLKEDVQNHLKQTIVTPNIATPTNLDTALATTERQEEIKSMSPLRRTIAKRLVESQQTTATLTTFNEIDMSVVKTLRAEYKEAFEKKHSARLGFMSFFVRAVIESLKGIPQINAKIDGNNIIYHNYYDIGIAVSGKKGLLVPVIRNAERLSLADIEKAIADFGKRAQANKITPEELMDGTFTISNGGVFGSLLSTPILNPPQSGVLGMHNIIERPVAVKGQVEIRPMMYVAFSYDHRIVDGREAVTFLRKVKEGVENPAKLLLEI